MRVHSCGCKSISSLSGNAHMKPAPNCLNLTCNDCRKEVFILFISIPSWLETGSNSCTGKATVLVQCTAILLELINTNWELFYFFLPSSVHLLTGKKKKKEMCREATRLESWRKSQESNLSLLRFRLASSIPGCLSLEIVDWEIIVNENEITVYYICVVLNHFSWHSWYLFWKAEVKEMSVVFQPARKNLWGHTLISLVKNSDVATENYNFIIWSSN